MDAIVKIVISVVILGSFIAKLFAVQPQVWLGDRTNSCIIIVNADGTESPCPEDKSQLVGYEPVYVIEETDYE